MKNKPLDIASFLELVIEALEVAGVDYLYTKPPDHEVYSSKFLKVVRVCEVPSSNLGTTKARRLFASDNCPGL